MGSMANEDGTFRDSEFGFEISFSHRDEIFNVINDDLAYINDHIIQWFDDNNILEDDWWIFTWPHYSTYLVLFEHEVDAMAFKLRWL